MTRAWLAGAAAFAMMTGAALAQSVPSGSSTSTQPAATSKTAPVAGTHSAAIVTTPLPAPAAGASQAPNSSITNYGAGGMQPLPGSPAAAGVPPKP